jgi:hypothetical protein
MKRDVLIAALLAAAGVVGLLCLACSIWGAQ